MLFRKKVEAVNDAEWRFQTVLDIVKDFDKPNFKKFMGAIDLAWSGYDKALRAPTRGEKETGDIDEVEMGLLETEKGVKN